MTGTFEFFLVDGRACKIEATYECVMESEVIDADGDKVIGNPRPTTSEKCNMVAYIDGKKVDSCWNPSSWQLIDVEKFPGIKKIWGIGIGFSKPEDAERYEKWISGIIENGKSEEVKAYERAEKEERTKRMIESARKTIQKAESQKDIPTKEEAERRMKEYNDFMNEGGWGYVPYIVNSEQYENAKKFLAEVCEQ